MASDLGISTGSLYDLDVPTEEAVESIAALGAPSVEVFVQGEPELRPSFLEVLYERCRSARVRVNSVHPYVFAYEPLLYTSYRRQAAWAVDRLVRHLEICAALGARHYVCHGPPRHLVTDEGGLTAAYCEVTAGLARRAAEHGVLYCVENTSYALLQQPAHVLEHRERVEAPNLRFVLDVKSAWKVGRSAADYVEAMDGALAFAHVSFRDAERGLVGTCYRGDEPDLERALRQLNGAAVSGDHIVEVSWARDVADVGTTLAQARRHAGA